MSRNRWKLKLWTAVATVAMLASLTVLMSGQENPQQQRVPGIEDWSTHHMVFSNPGSFAQATQSRSFVDWYKIQMDPRYKMFLAKRNATWTRAAGGASVAPTTDRAGSLDSDLAIFRPSPKPPPLPKKTPKPQGDWSNYLGGTASAGMGLNMYPAKYTWDVNATPDCTNDFLVVPVNKAPSNVTRATGTIVIVSDPPAPDTITIGSSVYDWHNTQSLCVTGQKCVDHTGYTTSDATNLANAIAGTCFNGACAVDPAVTVSSVSSSTVNLQAIATGPAGSVTLATNDTYSIYLNGVSQASSSLTGGQDGQASIIAFNNLYSGAGESATQIGAVSSNGATSTSTVTIGSVTLDASAPTPATQIGTFASGPTSSSNSISVKVGSNTLNLSTNSTPASSTGTFTGAALYTTSISFTSGGNTLTMTPGGTAQTAAAAFTAVPARTSPGMTITNGTKVLTVTPGGTPQTAAATFTAVPLTTSNPIVITSNSTTLTMTPGGAAANAVGTFAGTLTTAITITSGSTVTTITPTGVGFVNDNGTQAGFDNGDAVTIGSLTYTAQLTSSACSAGPCFWEAHSNADGASSLYAVITNDQSKCPSDVGTSFSSISGYCFTNGATSTSVTATLSGTVITLTNITSSGVALTRNSTLITDGSAVISPTSGGILAPATGACAGSGIAYSGSFIGSGTLSAEQSNLLSLLQGCPSAVGFTATTGGTNAVQVSYPAPGSLFTLTGAGNVTGIFTWTNNLGNNGSAPTCTSSGPYTGTFVNSNVAATLATNFYNAVSISACATGMGYSVPSPGGGTTVTLTDLSPGASASIGAFSGAAGNGVTWVNNNGTDLGAATCSGSVNTYTGTLVNSNVANTLATNFYNALTTGTCATNVAYSVPAPGAATVTLTDLYLGTAANVGTFTGAAGNGVSWTYNVGTTGSATCTGSGTAYTGTFVNSTTVGTLGNNFNSALNTSPCPASVGFSTSHTTGSAAVTVTDTKLGTATFGATNATSIFSWSPSSAGGNGSYTCSGSAPTFTATYITDPSTANLASNLSSAISSCNASAMGITSGSVVGSSFTISDATPGTGGNGGTTLTPTSTSGYFYWGSGSLAGGTDGTTNGSGFAYVSAGSPVSTTQLATNIAAAINANTTLQGTSGVTDSVSGNVITVTARTAGTDGNSIALDDSLSGFAWGGTTLEGGSANSYCNTAGPSVKWAYNASTGGTASPILGSPILSWYGNKVAFIESSTSGAILHILRWKAGDGGTNLSANPVAPTGSYTNDTASYATCLAGTTSCMLNLSLGSNTNTNSPPFYDYLTDRLWVGDDKGLLWQVTGVFGVPGVSTGTTPTVTTASPWNYTASGGLQVNTSTSAILTGPVYDYASGYVLVGDSTGQLASVNPAATSGTNKVTVATSSIIADGPVVDSSTDHVYVFSGGNSQASLVTQYAITTATGALGTKLQVTTAGSNLSAGSQMHDGIFDNIFYNSSGGTGNLYVCGKGSSTAAGPVLYSIPITAGVMSTSVGGTSLGLSTSSTAAQQCSPLSEIDNTNQYGGVDWLFVGVPANCALGGTNTAAGCIMSFDITNGFPTAVYAAGPETSGTTGIAVDNVSPLTQYSQASSAYFLTLGSPGSGSAGCTSEPTGDSTTCLVKRTQNGLQ